MHQVAAAAKITLDRFRNSLVKSKPLKDLAWAASYSWSMHLLMCVYYKINTEGKEEKDEGKNTVLKKILKGVYYAKFTFWMSLYFHLGL